MRNYCPICKKRNTRQVSMIRDVPINQIVSKEDKAKTCIKGKVHLVQCQACGFVYNCQFDDELYWNNCQIINVSTSSHKFDSYLQMIAEIISEFFGQEKIVCLEIGCGDGQFLKKLYYITNWKMIGFDPFCKLQKFDNFALYDSKFTVDKLDVIPTLIICRHVIEHIDDLKKFLGDIKRCISKSNGFIYFETPDLEWSINNIGVLDFFYEHCNYFSLITLKLLLHKMSFKILWMKKLFDSQHLGIIAKMRPQGVFGQKIIERKEIDRQIVVMSNYYEKEQLCIRNWKTGIQVLRKNGKIGILGASSKGCTFLNIIDPRKELIEFAIDYNIKKAEKYIAGTGHPIISVNDDDNIQNIKFIIVINEAYYEECMQWSGNVKEVYTLKMLEEIGKSRR